MKEKEWFRNNAGFTCKWLTMQYSSGSSRPQVEVAVRLIARPIRRFPVAG